MVFHVLIYVEGFYGKGGDLMLKKFISTFVLICVMTCCFSFNVFAETTVDDEIALTNLYTNKISTNITRSSSKKISYDCSVTGKSTATKITVYLYLQGKCEWFMEKCSRLKKRGQREILDSN